MCVRGKGSCKIDLILQDDADSDDEEEFVPVSSGSYIDKFIYHTRADHVVGNSLAQTTT